MKLYGFPGSPNTWKVRALADHIGVPVELQIVDLTKGEQKSPAYLAINPTGRTPSLVDGELKLFESTAIMQYIGAKAKSDLWPDDDATRALIMQWQSWQLQHWAKACEPLLGERIVKAFFKLGEPDQAVIAKAEETFRNEARILDAHLAKHAHLVSSQLTIADFSVAAYLFLAERAQMPMAEFKNVGRWFKSVASLPAWAHTAPQM